MSTLFPQPAPDRCRVCNEPVDDGRRNYCSDRCKRIANAVQRKFLWEQVRERVLERDEWTCQRCGLSKDQHQRAYRQIKERIAERNPHDPATNRSKWRQRDETLRKRYNLPDLTGYFHVDHIQPISEGGHPFDETNLQTLCKACHQDKTAQENRAEQTVEQRPEVGLDAYLAPAECGESSQ